jgi:uracil-DNA glycosylase family 4
MEALIQGEGPGKEEDRFGEPWRGQVGQWFRPFFPKHGLDMKRDCIVINTLDCRPMDRNGNNRPPSSHEIKCCYKRKVSVFEEYQPKVIFLVGDAAIDSFYGCHPYRREGTRTDLGPLGLAAFRGKVIPDRELNCWVCHTYHPSFLVRGKQDQEHIFALDFAVFASMVGKPRPNFKLYQDSVEILTEYDDVMNLLDDFWTDPFVIDYESSSYRYYEGNHKVHLITVAKSSRKAFVFPYDFHKPDGDHWWRPKQFRTIGKYWKRIIKGPAPKIAHHIKHEEKASRAVFGCGVNNWDHCTMIGAHILDESKKTKGLKIQTYMNWGYHYGGDVKGYLEADPKGKNKFEQLPIETSGLYGGRDGIFPYRLSVKQKKLIRAQGLERAYQLFHEGTLALAEVEQEGIRINVDQAETWDREWGDELNELKERILTSSEAKRFEKKMGRPLGYKKKLSPKDLQVVLFDILKMKPIPGTERKTGWAVDEDSLIKYSKKCELLSWELRARKLEKRKNTYLAQFLRLQVDGFIYPSFNLHIPRSYRSSSNEPNFQNVIKHDPEGAVIRKLIIARDGNLIYTVDYGGMEVRIIACVTKDGALIEYILSGHDFHGDIAEWIFGSDYTKDLRQATKNDAVFPWFYGSYFKSIAKSFWTDPLVINTGFFEGFYPTMTSRRRYEKWEAHVKSCEQKFWKLFHGVREWQDEYVKLYQKTGVAQDLSWGFRRRGYLVRNKLFNFPIQGPAFHCLLWSVIQIVKMKLREQWQSKLCGQIHDENFFDMVPSEADSIVQKVDKIMIDDVREANPWIIVPLATEWKRGENWLGKRDDNPNGMAEF